MSQKVNFFKQVSLLQSSDRLLFVQFKSKSKQILSDALNVAVTLRCCILRTNVVN